MRSIGRDDNSRKTKPTSVGWTTTVLQIYRSQMRRLRFGMGNIEDVALLFAAFLILPMQRCICRWLGTKGPRPRRLPHGGVVSCPGGIHRSAGIPALAGMSARFEMECCCVLRNMHMVGVYTARRSMLAIIVMIHHKWPYHTFGCDMSNHSR